MSAPPFFFNPPEDWKGVHSLESMFDVHSGLAADEHDKRQAFIIKNKIVDLARPELQRRLSYLTEDQVGALPIREVSSKDFTSPFSLRRAATSDVDAGAEM